MSFEGHKGRFNIKNAVRHGVITGIMGWAAIEGVQAYQPNAHQIFAERGAQTQFYSGDVDFGFRPERSNAVDVTYRGRSIAAIPSISFEQPQAAEHKARQSGNWTARNAGAHKDSESPRRYVDVAQVASTTPSYVDSVPSLSPSLSFSEAPAPVQIPPWVPLAVMAPEMIYAAGTTLNKTLIHSSALQRRLNAVELAFTEARLLASCAVPITAIAPTEARPAITVTAPVIAQTTETQTPPPGFQKETPAPPVDLVSVHPDFHDTDLFNQITFTSGATPEQLTASNPLGLPAYALDAYQDNIKAIQAKVTGEQGAKVFWSSDYSKNFVLLTRVNSGSTEVAIIAAGTGNVSYHPNAEWFDFTPTEAPKYIWVALPSGFIAENIVGGYQGEYPVWGVADSNQVLSVVYAPGSDAQFVESPVPVEPFAIEALTLAPEQAAAMRAHTGLEASITAEADGQFSTNVQVLNTAGQPTTETMHIDPNTLHEDLTSKNEYGNTPVMTTVDGKKLYWIQEEKAWFAVEISPDINKPVLIPLGKTEIATRITIVEFPEDFSQEAVDWWKKTPGLYWEFTYLIRNANSGEGTKFGYLRNRALSENGRTAENSPVQYLDAWFAMDTPDGTRFQFFPTKWLNPVDPRNPKGDEWAIIFTASGPEVMDVEGNRHKYDELLTQASNPNTRLEVVPIFVASDDFFDETNNLITFMVAQPSLEKLFALPRNNIARITLPDGSGATYKVLFDMHLPNLSAENLGFGVGANKDDLIYNFQFIASDIQTLIVPSMIISR